MCSKTEKFILGWQARILGWVLDKCIHAFRTNQMQCSYQALDVGYCELFPAWKCTSNGDSVADAGTAFPVGPGPLLSTWQSLAEPKLISSVIQSMEKYRGCLRELPGKTIHSQPRPEATPLTGHLC